MGTWGLRCGEEEGGDVGTHGVQGVLVVQEALVVREEVPVGLEVLVGRPASPLGEQVSSEGGTGSCGSLWERSGRGSARCSQGLALLAEVGDALLAPWVRVGRREPQSVRYRGYRKCVSGAIKTTKTKVKLRTKESSLNKEGDVLREIFSASDSHGDTECQRIVNRTLTRIHRHITHKCARTYLIPMFYIFGPVHSQLDALTSPINNCADVHRHTHNNHRRSFVYKKIDNTHLDHTIIILGFSSALG